MTKRTGAYEQTTCKKSKPNKFDVDNDPWGDEDLDISVIEDCFKLAEKYNESNNINCTQLNNVSILPTYNAFKKQTNMFTSTQSGFNTHPSSYKPTTSKGACNTNSSPRFSRYNSIPPDDCQTSKFSQPQSDLQTTLQDLQQKLQAKDGEVSILRSQLKELKANIEIERQKREKEWNDKLAHATKEMNTVKTQLDFKNLEIANLKQKVHGITKHIQLEASFSCTQSTVSKVRINNEREVIPQLPKEEKIEKCNKTEIQPVFVQWYPLKSTVPQSIFNIAKPEKYFLNVESTNMYINSLRLFHCPQIQNKTTTEEDSLQRLSSSKLNMGHILNDIDYLIRLNWQQLQSVDVIPNIKKILCVSLQLLHDLWNYLKQLAKRMKTNDVNQLDVSYLRNNSDIIISKISVFDGREMCENEIGISVRQSIAFLSELVLHNPFLKNYFLENQSLELDNNNVEEDAVPFVNKAISETPYLNVVLSCLRIIGKLRKSEICTGFLCAVTNLLSNLFYLSPVSANPLLFAAMKEIIFLRPTTAVLYNLSFLLKNASQDQEFVQKLCTTVPENTPKMNLAEGILNYNDDSCVFHVLVVLYENNMRYLDNQDKDCCRENLLWFIYNALAVNRNWFSYCENKLFNKLAIETIYGVLQAYKEQRKKCIVRTNDLRRRYERFSISVDLLHILNFKMCLLIEKYMALDSQHKVAVSTILEYQDEISLKENQVKLLEKLDETEVNIEPYEFESVPFWL